jgi:hypothetical protein
MNPDPVGPENAAAPGDQLLENLGLLGGELIGRDVEKAAHEAYRSLVALIEQRNVYGRRAKSP